MNEKKEKYEQPEMEVMLFDDDVVATSDFGEETDDDE